uniref:Uncharacterized protein n=1 Tax=Macrostomum lignano TaxID=282301 RepID=A0A1I8GDL8_9PLAT
MSRKSITTGSRRSADWSAAAARRPDSGLLMRSVEVQTDSPSHAFGEYQDAYEVLADRGGGGHSSCYPDDGSETAANAWQAAYSTSQQLPGYHGLPVTQPVRFLNPYGKTVTLGPLPASVPAAPKDGSQAAFYRAGRVGSNWRHVTQCTGSRHLAWQCTTLATTWSILTRFPSHGLSPSCSLGAQAVPAAGLRPQATPRRPATGLQQQRSSKALQRARAGNKYWFEDKRPPTLTPSTIQGRIMKSGSAY